MGWFFGHTGFSFIDVWALVHFAFWIFVGSSVWAVIRRSGWRWGRPAALLACLALAYGWEVAEFFLAPRFHGLWGDWFIYQGALWGGICEVWTPVCAYESWWNSWVSDPLTCVLGVLLIWTLLDRRKS